jgi:hypothetical protein
VREYIDAVTLDGLTLRVAARGPASVEPRTLAVATAIRAFERYPILERVVLTMGTAEFGVSRDTVQRLLGPGGFGAIREWGRWRQVLARVVQAYSEESA